MVAHLIKETRTHSLQRAFYCALKGMQYFFSKERNGKIQLFISICSIITGLALEISFAEWAIILTCIGAVLSLEMFNTAIEKLCDVVHEDFHLSIKIIKDISAGAVLWFSVISVVIGSIIFIPKIISLL